MLFFCTASYRGIAGIWPKIFARAVPKLDSTYTFVLRLYPEQDFTLNKTNTVSCLLTISMIVFINNAAARKTPRYSQAGNRTTSVETDLCIQ